MPYKDNARERNKENLRRKREELGNANVQRLRLFFRVRDNFEQQEKERSQGLPLTSLEPKPKKATLEKYGLEVFLADVSMFDLTTATNRNPFIQIRRPRMLENWAPPTKTTNSTAEVALQTIQLVQLKSAIDAKKDVWSKDVKEATIMRRWKDFKKLVLDSGCDDVAEWLNNGNLELYVEGLARARDTKVGYLKAFYVFAVKYELIPGVTDDTKERLTEVSSNAKEEVRYYQLTNEFEEVMKTPHFSTVLADTRAKFDELSDQVMLLRVYDERTLRNDYGDIILYRTDPGRLEEESYYVIDEGTIHFNGWKKTGTDKKRKPKYFKHKFESDLAESLKQYVEAHGGEKLFKNPTKILAKAGTNIRTLRRAKVREMYDDPTKTKDEKHKLAKEMKHSWSTQIAYGGTRSGKQFKPPSSPHPRSPDFFSQ